MVQRIHIGIYRSSNLSNFIKLLNLSMIIAKFKTLLIIFFFRMFPFPTKKKKEEERQKWKQLVNRQNRKGKLWSPSKDMRVCSKHFIDGEPTSNNPYPTEHLGYDSRRRVQNITPCSKRRKLYHLEDSVSVEEDNQVTIDSCSDHTVSMSTHSIDITQQGMPLPDLNSTSLREHDQNMDVSEGETLFPYLNSTESTQNDYLSSQNTMNTLEQEVTEESPGEVQSNDEHIRDADNDKHKVSSVNFLSLLIMWFSTFLFLTHALTSLCKMKCTLLALKIKVKRLEWEKKMHFEKIVCLQKELTTCKCKKPLHSTLLKMTRVLNFLLDLE